MGNIFLTVTVGPDYRLLPKFLEYYIKQGINRFLIILNTNDSGVLRILNNFKISPVYSWLEDFSEDTKYKNERQVINNSCAEDDWILYTDLDEFQYYPKGLIKTIHLTDTAGYDYIEGRLLDRVSESGKIADINIDNKLEYTFPMGGYITKALLKAWDKKIVAARKNKIVGGGHHIFLEDKSLKTYPYKDAIEGLYRDIIVHHFKWDSFVIERMKKYLSLNDKSLHYWKKEIALFLRYYEKHSKIKIDTKRFNFTKIDNILGV